MNGNTLSWNKWTRTQLNAIRRARRWRETVEFDGAGPKGLVRGRPMLSFASNDYLGLSIHPQVCAAAIEAIRRYGTGATASRLIVGTRDLHLQLEDEVMQWQRVERALIFPTGFAANIAVLSVMGAEDVTIYSDELNHASIIDGCRLSKARVVIYRHCDLGHLAGLMQASTGRKLVVSDVVFSMDGDVAPVLGLANLCAQYDALLVLDEAHAVLEPVHRIDGCEVLRVGTFSKMLGALGGWVAGSRAMIELLVNRARSFIFTTALSPPDTAAALAALRICRSDEGVALRSRLRGLIQLLRPQHPSPIVPIVFAEDRDALDAAAYLYSAGLYVPAIRPPSVPPGSSRLRVALSAAHSDAMVNQLRSALVQLPCQPSVLNK